MFPKGPAAEELIAFKGRLAEATLPKKHYRGSEVPPEMFIYAPPQAATSQPDSLENKLKKIGSDTDGLIRAAERRDEP